MKELFLENNGNETLFSVEFKIRDFKSVLPDNIESEHEMMMFCRSLAEELELFQKASKEMYSVLAETVASRLKGGVDECLSRRSSGRMIAKKR